MTAAHPAKARKKPPRHGPFATLRWNAAGGCWDRPLTPEGVALVEAFLARHPRPALVLYQIAPAAARVAFRRHGAEAVHQAARRGLVTAAALFNPAKGSFETHAVTHIKAAVQREFFLRRKKDPPPNPVRPDQCPPGDDGNTFWDEVSLESGRRRPPRLGRDGWERLLSCLPDARSRKIVVYRFVHDLSLEEIGAVFGVGKERVRQLLDRALRRIRDDRAFLLTDLVA